MSLNIEFPKSTTVTQRYEITETRWNDEDESTVIRKLGSVYANTYNGAPTFTQQITVDGIARPIGRSASLLSAIKGLEAFHKITNYQHAPWAPEESED